MSEPRPYDEDPQGSSTAPDEGGWSVNEQPRFSTVMDSNTPAFIDIPAEALHPQATVSDSVETIDAAIHEIYSDDTPAAEIAAEVQLVGDALPALAPQPDELPAITEEAASFVDADTQPFDLTDAPQTVAEVRLAALTRKIVAYPEVPVNYVLRGELYLSLNQPAAAAHDFEQAITLGEALDRELDWGYLNAAYIDRANEGLRRLTP